MRVAPPHGRSNHPSEAERIWPWTDSTATKFEWLCSTSIASHNAFSAPDRRLQAEAVVISLPQPAQPGRTVVELRWFSERVTTKLPERKTRRW